MKYIKFINSKNKFPKYHFGLRGFRQLSSFSFLQLVLLLCAILFNGPAAEAQFRAAVVKEDITPSNSQYLLGYGERKSTGVMDKIYHRIVAIDDGTTQFFIVSSDICLYSPSEYDKVTSRLQKEYGIDPLNVWWSTTHTHSAPEVGVFGQYGIYLGDRIGHTVDSVYTAMAEQKLIDGILKARKNLVPARLGIGWGFSQANINRPTIDEKGKASLGMNPGLPVDRRIGLLKLDKEDGTPLALIANYAMHGTVLGPENIDISGDAPGIVSEYVEQKIGVPVLSINGKSGNIESIYSISPTLGSGNLKQFHVILGDKILEVNRKIVSITNKAKFSSGETIVETQQNSCLGWSSDLANYTRTWEDGKNKVLLPILFLTINDDIAIWTAPLELLNEISNEIRNRSLFNVAFYLGYTNGFWGYLSTPRTWERGDYEIETGTPFTSLSEIGLKESVLGIMKDQWRRVTSWHERAHWSTFASSTRI